MSTKFEQIKTHEEAEEHLRRLQEFLTRDEENGLDTFERFSGELIAQYREGLLLHHEATDRIIDAAVIVNNGNSYRTSQAISQLFRAIELNKQRQKEKQELQNARGVPLDELQHQRGQSVASIQDFKNKWGSNGSGFRLLVERFIEASPEFQEAHKLAEQIGEAMADFEMALEFSNNR